MKSSKAVSHSFNSNSADNSSCAMKELINLFQDEINSAIEYDSFEYENSQEAIHILHGSPKLHKCQYKIMLAETELGQLTLTRKSPFAEDEMVVVERALGALTIHLHDVAESSTMVANKRSFA